MLEILSFTTENSNKFQKSRFWNEKSVEDVVTLGPLAQATLVRMNEAKMCDHQSNAIN
jgi:hypothetical protein